MEKLIMKRMIDGILDFQVTQGSYISSTDTDLYITFYFPFGYWPLSLISKPFSILPGRINWGDENDISTVCFPSGNRYFETAAFYSGNLNVTRGGVQISNSITYGLTFGNKSNRDAFFKELFGATATPKIGIDTSEEFDTPVYMLLAKVGGADQEY